MKKHIALGLLVTSIIFLAGCKNQQANQNQPLKNNASAKITYINSEFGFRLTLPAGWEKYKISVQKNSIQKGLTGIHVLLPTIDANWPGHYISDTETMRGYCSMFALSVWDLSLWNQEKNSKECKEEPVPGCPDESIVIAKNGNYVFEISGGQDYPNDLTKMIPESGFTPDFLKEKFELLSNQKVNDIVETKTILDKKALEDTAYSAVEAKTKGAWDKKIELGIIDESQKAVKGFWWAKDKWDWIAWQKDDEKWIVLVSMDGFNCDELNNIPSQYTDFFKDVTYQTGKKYCY